VTEDTYGIVKRLDFVAGLITRLRPSRVLDVGCGTGANLTAPLAGRFPGTEFLGLDSDPASIAYAQRQNAHRNARYALAGEAAAGTFDLVIASEVIEHVEAPDAFLDTLRSRVSPGGKVVLTLPNGYGPFELVSLAETVLHLSGVYGVLQRLKRSLAGTKTGGSTSATLAVSPHINFFSYRVILGLIAGHGFRILEYRARTFLCGLGFDQVIRSPRSIAWNARVADRLPPQAVSAWLFLLEPGGTSDGSAYRRGRCARLRRRLNEKRWSTG
jgi:SAM-dependent methyltransferase